MRPSVGVLAEVIILAAVLSVSSIIPQGVLYLLFIVIAELLATYLIHCPAHYIVGRSLGIRFASMRLGRTTLAKALPESLAPVARLLPVVTLRTEKPSMAAASKKAKAAMFASGTIASTGVAFAIAASVSYGGPVVVAASWIIALAYLGFDLAFSPKSGDFMRARAALR